MRHPRTTTDYWHPYSTNEDKHIRMTAKHNKLHTMSLVLSLAMVCALLPAAMADAEWMSDCGVCHCKWISSKKMAECKNKSLISVPKEMSSELQVIDLSNNIIPELRNNEFRDANLSNLHKIYMRNCTLVEIARDAFKSLNLLIELDLSNNDLKVLHPGVFIDVIRLRVFTMQYNQLEHLDDSLFDNLTFLAKVDFRHNQLKSVSTHAFVNVSVLREINLEYNQLTLLKEETFRDLDRLSSLTLNENPWNCTCDLQAFQKFAISRRLYTPPTDCHYPMHLRGKLWTDIPAEHFACKPVILYPYDVVTLDATNENITITCRMKGSPKPQIKWLYNNHAINMADPRVSIRFAEEANRRDSTEFYVADMTIVGVRNEDRGTYTCVASNTGGEARADTHVAVPPVLESIDGLNVIGSTVGIPTPNPATNLLYFACLIAIILLTLLIIIVLILCCYCRRVKRYSKNGSISENGLMTSKMDRSTDGSMLEGSVIMEMQKSLLTEVNPVEKPPRRNEVDGKNCSSDEIPEIKKTLLEDQCFGKFKQ